MYILGVSAFYHDSAACLIKDGEIVAAAQEERFTRKKHDKAFPLNAIQYCLKEEGLDISQVEYLAFYEKPFLKFERLLETYLSYAPIGLKNFLVAMPVWLKEKLFLKSIIKKEIRSLSEEKRSSPKILFTTHHQSHAASAFFPSPFQKSAVLCMDGVGEWTTTSVWIGEDNSLTPKWEMRFPHSLGLLYSAFTYYIGFKVNSGEYKLMGLAPYGEPIYKDLILKELIDLKADGTFRLNMKYFNFASGLTMTNKKFHDLFKGEPRIPETAITQREKDIARSIQEVTEEIVLRLTHTIKDELEIDRLCLAGGVALNCVANGKVLGKEIFENIWIQPAAGDSGGALGAALSVWFQYLGKPRVQSENHMKGSLLGPKFQNEEVEFLLKSIHASYDKVTDLEKIELTSDYLKNGSVVGWFQGRMEFGPRALGNRSILGDSQKPDMQRKINLKIKFRESFRPFAPIVINKDTGRYFQLAKESPFMAIVAPVLENKNIPAVTHVDSSARIQTVRRETNETLFELLTKFKEKTSCSVLVNTSFNVRGEPIVCSPEDALRCFMKTDMDVLVIENFILKKDDQREGLLDSLPSVMESEIINKNIFKRMYSIWMTLGDFLGAINSKILLSLLYLVVFTSIHLILRLIGKDYLNRKLDSTLKSYRIESESHAVAEYMESPF